MRLLRAIYPIPAIGRRVVRNFDPNRIRKTLGFDRPNHAMRLRDDRWVLTVDTSDHIGFTTFVTGEPFEMAVYRLAEKLGASERRVIIDIGANIGTASVPICAINDYELLAVEASKVNAALLLQNIADNGIRAKVFCAALVDVVGEDYIKLFVNAGNTGANSLIPDWSPGNETGQRRFEYTPAKTLDALMQESGVPVDSVLLVKIDVEGMEEAVLAGGAEFLQSNTAPILLEYRVDATQRFLHKGMEGVVALLDRANYELFSLTGNDFELGAFDPARSYDNVVALKRNSSLNPLLGTRPAQ